MRILQSLEQERIVIVAGFQGMSRKGEITTLGRGGSDTTAVALAVALGSDMVEFYKDVGGIYDQDPHLYSNAKLLRDLSFDEALSLAEDGAKVLHARSIKLAQANGVKLHVVPFSLEKGSSGSVVGFRASRFKNNQFEQE
jgi:aspartate kinase